jgi:Flp pilus assembly protein TadG
MEIQMRHDSERGQSMVEFALALPILVLVIFGLVDLGRAVYINNSLAEAARDGARYGSVQARAYDDARLSGVEAWVADRLNGVPSPTITAECTPSRPALGCTVNDVLVVTVASDVQMITPIIGQIVGTLSLEGRSEVLVNN